jgi:tetratricopeptide (TPR) repeat protein
LLDGLGTLQLLIAVCENDALRYEMIERYEQALKPEAQVWRVTLDPIEPSLRQALYELTVQQTLTDYSAQIVTVLGAEKLDSEALKKFWGYLQWTREGLRAFPWPIVLWVPQRLLKEMTKKAPDFWRWRGGIFLFTLQTPSELSPTELMSSGEFSSSSSSLFSVEQLEDSLEKAIQQWGEDSPKLASLYGQLGKAYGQQIEQGHYTTVGQEASRAEQLLQKAINQSSQPSDFLAENLNNLAGLYRSQGKYAEAEPLIERSLTIWENQLGEDHPSVATSLNNLALLYKSQGKYEEAEPLYLRSLAIMEKQLGENHPLVATSLNNLAGLYGSQEKYAEAEHLIARSLAIDEKVYGENHPEIATDLNNLAELYRTQGKYAEAESLYRRSLAIMEKQLGENHPLVATSLNNLAALCQSQGKYEEAEPLYQRAIAILLEKLGENHPNTQTVTMNYYQMLAQLPDEELNQRFPPEIVAMIQSLR